MEINVTVNVDDIDLTTVISTRRQYMGDDEGYDNVDVTIADRVAEQLVTNLTKDDQYPQLKELVKQIREEEIRAAIKPAVETAVAKPIQRTNSYGSPVGEQVTLTELVIQEAQVLLKKPSDSYNSNSLTFVQKLVRDEVTRALGNELKEAIAAEKTKVVAAVRAQAADLIAESIRKGIGG